MISGKLFNHLTRLLCLFSLVFSVFCSRRFNIHVSILQDNCIIAPSLQNPVEISIYERKIVPWLRQIGRLSTEEISSINLASLDRLVNSSQLPPLFHDSKKLFELVELLIDNNLDDIGSAVLKYMRSALFNHYTYKIVLQSLNLDKSTVFDQILKIWFPKRVDILSLIHNLVYLRLGEDDVLEIIYLTWPKLISGSSEELLKKYFAKILGSAMLKQYVSVFEDILERLPDLIQFIHQEINHKSTVIHFFCRAADPVELNKLKTIRRTSSLSDDDDDESDSPQCPYYDHLIRGYPTANKDLLDIMIKYGADINALDCNGLTPLNLAIDLKNVHIVQVLVDAGANVNICDANGMTLLHHAINSKDEKIAEILIKSGRADLNARDVERMTPLHRAIRVKNSNIVQMLLEAGADYTITSNGRNIYQLIYAFYSYEVEVVVNDFLTSFRVNRSRTVSSSK